MQFQVELKGKRKPVEFYFPNDKPIEAYRDYLADKTKNAFVGNEGGYSIVLDFNEVAMMRGEPDPTFGITVARS